MKILHATSELAPFTGTGGLGETVAALTSALASQGHSACVALPCYRGLAAELDAQPTGVQLDLRLGGRQLKVDLLETLLPSGVQLFLIQHDESFDRSGLYGDAEGDFADNAARFILFSKAVAALAKRLSPSPDLIHLHDWQTALVPVLARFSLIPTETVLTLHNVTFQGVFSADDFAQTGLPPSWFESEGFEFHGRMNLLKAGILSADALVAPSQFFSNATLTPQGGCGLDGVLRSRHQRLHAVLGGVEPQRTKKKDRAGLLKALDLLPQPKGPIIAMPFANPAALDLLLPVLDRLLSDDVRMAVFGDGEFSAPFEIALRKYPGKLAWRSTSEIALGRLAESAADLALFPAGPEPSGTSVMRCLQSATIPIAPTLDGIHPLLRNWEPDHGTGWSLLFREQSPEGVWDALRRAKRLFADPEKWQPLATSASAQDFSWERSAKSHEALYATLQATLLA